MTLHIEDLGVNYGAVNVVAGVSLRVERGAVLALLGASGSGKSSVLRAAAGLIECSGTVFWDDEDLSRVAAHRRGIGMMFQDHALFGHLDVARNIAFGLRMQGVARHERDTRVRALLDLVGLGGYERRAISSLSGGEQQRVALARALAPSPRVLLLDEPFGALDRVLRERLVQEVGAIVRDAGIATIIVTHDHDEAFAIAGEVAILTGGVIAQSAAPADIWEHPNSPEVCAQLGFGLAMRGIASDAQVDVGWALLAHQSAIHAGPVDVVLRPDAWSLDANGTVRGTVVQVRPSGATMRATVKIDGGPEISAAIDQIPSHDDGLVPGAVVALRARGQGVLVFAQPS